MTNRKKCARCGRRLSLIRFRRDRCKTDGRYSACRDCERAKRLRATYGLTEDRWRKLLKRYGGKCWVCQRRPATVVDHCHASEKVRGMLCSGCNTGIGLLRDCSANLMRAAYYVTKGLRERHDDDD